MSCRFFGRYLNTFMDFFQHNRRGKSRKLVYTVKTVAYSRVYNAYKGTAGTLLCSVQHTLSCICVLMFVLCTEGTEHNTFHTKISMPTCNSLREAPIYSLSHIYLFFWSLPSVCILLLSNLPCHPSHAHVLRTRRCRKYLTQELIFHSNLHTDSHIFKNPWKLRHNMFSMGFSKVLW